MSCINAHHMLDLYLHEGSDDRLLELNEHAARCAVCRMSLSRIKQTVKLLSVVGDEEPAGHIIDDILSEVAASQPKPVRRKTGVEVIPVLQIAFGEIFVFALIYFIKIQLSMTSIVDAVNQVPVLRTIGTLGVSVILVLIAGAFITLALAPILLMDSEKKFSR
jgi:hypothetical protein